MRRLSAKFRPSISRVVNPSQLPSLVVVFLSMLTVITSLMVSLRVLDLTGSPAKQSLAIFAYNTSYTLTSLLLRRIEPDGKLIRKIYTAVVVATLPLVALFSLSNNYYIILGAFTFFASMISILNPLAVGMISRRTKKDSEISVKYNYYNSLGSTIGYLLAGILSGIADLSYLIITLGLVVLVTGLGTRREIELGVPRVLTSPLPHQHTLHVSLDIIDKVIDLRHDIFYLRLFLRKLSLNLKRRYFLTQLGIFIFFIAVGLFFTPLPSTLSMAGLSKREVYLEYAVFNLFSVVGFQSIASLNLTLEKMYNILGAATLSRCLLFILPSLIFTAPIGPNLWFITGIMLLVGYTWAFLGTTMLGILLYLVPHSEKARAASSFNALSSLGTVMGSLLATFIVNSLEVKYSYIASGLVALAALFLFLKSRSAILS